jgi:transcriptional regulator of acetoin/glycerol metabolism
MVTPYPDQGMLQWEVFDMATPEANPPFDDDIKASWDRCELRHRLVRSTSKPVLRLQTSELAPRLEELLDRTGGRLGIFSELSKLATDAGQSLVVTDAEAVVVRFESQSFLRDAFEANGISLGSCWDERTAGTNGVSMALMLEDAITVRGREHFHKSLNQFACTAVRILDAENHTIGAVSLSAFDRGNPSDFLIAKNLLLAAVGRVQTRLFEAKFSDHAIVSILPSDQGTLLRRKGLVAIDGSGLIVGATGRALELAGPRAEGNIEGQRFDAVFGVDADTLKDIPDRVLSLTADDQASLNFSVQFPDASPMRPRPFAFSETSKQPKRRVQRRALTFSDLSRGSALMARNCARVEALLRRATPFVIEGETGTGKSAVLQALKDGFGLAHAQILTVDCAALTDTAPSRDYIQTIYDQARVVQVLGEADQGPTVLVFDNIDELPGFAQPGLRSLLEELEQTVVPLDSQRIDAGLRVVAISRDTLSNAAQTGAFRKDLYYLLAGAIIRLPALREREGLADIAQYVGSTLAGADVQITDEALDMLAAHDWPGNLRELRSVLQDALLEGNGQRISPVELHLLTEFAGEPPRLPYANAARPRPAIQHGYSEKTLLLDALTNTGWNVTKAADILGMGRATINRKIKKHGLTRPG